jgi:DHA2 family multidrug resistance protein
MPAPAIAKTESGLPNKWPITISIMLATVMNSLDTTIANVALPHIQGSVSASQDQITWVLTSYIVAATIMTPMTGWLAGRIGRKTLLLIAIAGFTVASALCGMASSLAQIVGFRLLQGLFGASGPALGGYLTDNFSWRWVFYINLPIGVMAYVGTFLFIGNNKLDISKPFDFFGFGVLAVFIAAFQLVLDRGPTQDWLGSKEIWTEAIVAVVALYLFIVHSLTAKNPFFERKLFADRSFVVASFMGFFLGILLYSTMALLPTMLEELMGYPVVTTGMVMMPRGVGAFVATFAVGRLVGKVDSRLSVGGGLFFMAFSTWQMSKFSLEMDSTPLMVSAFMQGLGTGSIFVPLTTLAFATMTPSFRAEGSSVFTLVRNLGSSAGISIIEALQTNNVEVVHTGLVSHLQPGSANLAALANTAMNPATTAGAAALNAEVNRQAAMVAYIDDFWLMVIIAVGVAPLLFLMSTPRQKLDPEHAVAE